ncbi:MAG: FAD binding domain-containing protein [Anaerolineae bacterium]
MPLTPDEAVRLLSDYGGRARIIAGGTDLLVDMRAALSDPAQAGSVQPHHALVDITRIPDMTRIEQDGDYIVIGAGVTHTQIVASNLLRHHAACLVESCGVVGGPQVRNVATLGGNVAHALPAGDGTTSLVALDAQAEIIQNGERRWVNILDMFIGTAKSLVDPTRDLLVRFRFRTADSREATAFSRVMRPQGVALPILGCAVWIKLNAARTHYELARVCIAPVAPTPKRADAVEAALAGQPVGEAAIEAAIEAAESSLHPRTSKFRATAAYRDEIMGVLLRRTLSAAVQRATDPAPSTP